MGLITRYFSTAEAGAADGTTWADRAALFVGGVLSDVLTSHDFSSDGILALIGPGSYSQTSTWNSATWTGQALTAPSVLRPLILHACSDGSNGQAAGDPLNIPDPDWTSAQPAWDASGMPQITLTGNITMGTTAGLALRLIKATGGRNGSIVSAHVDVDWCQLTNVSTGASGAVLATAGVVRARNSVFSVAGSAAYDCVVFIGNSEAWDNVRLVGEPTAISGDRDGITYAGSTARTFFNRLCIFGNVRHGFLNGAGNAGVTIEITNSVIAGNGGDAISWPSTASQTNNSVIQSNMLTGNTGAALNAQSQGHIIALHNRVRDNGSGLTNFTNYPTLLNYTTDSDDATEYVNAAGGDYRIKAGSAIHGQGYGVSDEPASGGGGVGSIFNTVVR